MKAPFPEFTERLDQTARTNAWRFLKDNQHYATYLTCFWLQNELDRLGEHIVAKIQSKKGKKTDEFSKADWVGFVDVPLSDTDKVAIRAAQLASDEVFEGLLTMLADGHKVTVSHNPQSGLVSASATGHYQYCANAGKTLSCTGKDITTALTVLLYKHFTKAKGVWGEAVQIGDDDIS